MSLIRTRPTSTAFALSATQRRRAWSSPSQRCEMAAASYRAHRHGRPEEPHDASTWRTESMTDISNQDLGDYREQAETSRDEPLSPAATRPGWQRGKVLSVRMSADE